MTVEQRASEWKKWASSYVCLMVLMVGVLLAGSTIGQGTDRQISQQPQNLDRFQVFVARRYTYRLDTSTGMAWILRGHTWKRLDFGGRSPQGNGPVGRFSGFKAPADDILVDTMSGESWRRLKGIQKGRKFKFVEVETDD